MLFRYNFWIAAGRAWRRNNGGRGGSGIGRPDLHLRIDVIARLDDTTRSVELFARRLARTAAARRRAGHAALAGSPWYLAGRGTQQRERDHETGSPSHSSSSSSGPAPP